MYGNANGRKSENAACTASMSAHSSVEDYAILCKIKGLDNKSKHFPDISPFYLKSMTFLLYQSPKAIVFHRASVAKGEETEVRTSQGRRTDKKILSGGGWLYIVYLTAAVS